MGARYASWVEGLNSDWAVSRQRYFGVPIPAWYRVDADGQPDHEDPILPEESALPIDPQDDVPAGYTAAQRGEPGGFVGDPDVMDTWATSSLTPQIAGGWEEDVDLFGRVFPMDHRPQAHEIIRTWLFYTILRSELEHGVLPWSNAVISGFVLDPERKKMSKSKGNVVTPIEMFERHSADAVRYWAGSARLGIDAAFDEQQMRVGRRLAIKILNASRFVLSFEAAEGDVTDPIDRSMLASLVRVVEEATRALEGYDHARALEVTERFFWGFTDDYLELVKNRAYGEGLGAASAIGALRMVLSVLLRLFAPFLPYVTEEVWSWWRKGSIHRARWPSADELSSAADADAEVYEVAAQVLTAVRKEKALAKVSLRAPVERVRVRDSEARIGKLKLAQDDLVQAGNIEDLGLSGDGDVGIDVVLKPVGA
jgi:valyl-tRNA synthetase